MRFIKRSARTAPKVSLVLLDWSVRESFHLLDYLRRQTAPRDDFEVIVIEYYARVSEAIAKFAAEVDTWIVLEMPEHCYYHKHLMYNVGIVLARGDIVMIGDSDAMVKPAFIETILRHFARPEPIVLHMDEFRNMRRDFYPFNHPTFEAVLGDGCINNGGGKTTGVLDQEDPIHSRNYGACMCARRDDLLAIGGADMHIDYLGHICGPYDMTFRLINFGRREVWDRDEFLYHTWHPGQAGADNYLGPHDGRHMSSTALEALASGRVRPLVEHPAIARLRERPDTAADELIGCLVDSDYARDWDIEHIKQQQKHRRWNDYRVSMGVYKGYRLQAEVDRVFAYPLARGESSGERQGEGRSWSFEGADIDEVRRHIDASLPASLRLAERAAKYYALLLRLPPSLAYRSRRLPGPKALRIGVAALMALPLALVAVIVAPGRVWRKLRHLRTIVYPVAVRLGEITVALYGIGRHLPAENRSLVVLVESEDMRRYLSAMVRLGVIEASELRVVVDAPTARSSLERVQGADATLVIPTELYTRLHTVWVGRRTAGRAIVI